MNCQICGQNFWDGVLAGLAAETGVVMLVYLDQAFDRGSRERGMKSAGALQDAIMEGTVDRVRPKLMTVSTTLIGLLPIMWGSETGSEVMKRIAAPMVGGLISSTALTLVIIPAVYALWKGWNLKKEKKNEKFCCCTDSKRCFFSVHDIRFFRDESCRR